MRNLLFFCLTLLFFKGFGQNNQKNSKGKRIGHWVYYGKDRPRSNYPSSVKIEEGNYINGYREGIWVKYYKDGKTKKLEGNYINNRPMGMYTRYYSNGLIMEKGYFSYKNFSGPYIRYFKNGKTSYRCTFNKQGKEMGTVEHYHTNGNLSMKYTAKDGKVVGKLTTYHEDGSEKEIIMYNQSGTISSIKKFDPKKVQVVKVPPQNKKIYPPKVQAPNTHGIKFEPYGNNRIYTENDAIWMDGIFKKGQLWDGNVYDYDEDGILIKVRVFKKGIYHSDGQL